MINTLDDYIFRSIREDFAVNPNLTKKVDEQGRLLPYAGNTVVYLLDDDTRQQLRQIRDELYRSAGEMLAEPLQESTFHMTLHDLANGCPGREGLAEWMRFTEARAAALLERWGTVPPIRMKATWLFNMVNTSIVLGLRPAEGEDWQRLDGMYMELENVVSLGYGLTPHITMAYFRPGTWSPDQIRRLAEAMRPVELDVELRGENLVLQSFSDMNHYETIRNREVLQR